MGEFFQAVGDFFVALGDALAALWGFGEGWYGLIVTIGWAAAAIGFLFLALKLRDEHGWVSATLGTMSASIAAFWAFGILPSAWIYYVDAESVVLAGRIVPEALDPVASNFYQVFRDSIVMAETVVAMVAFVVVALLVQKRYPRALAEGEEARPQSGGYK